MECEGNSRTTSEPLLCQQISPTNFKLYMLKGLKPHASLHSRSESHSKFCLSATSVTLRQVHVVSRAAVKKQHGFAQRLRVSQQAARWGRTFGSVHKQWGEGISRRILQAAKPPKDMQARKTEAAFCGSRVIKFIPQGPKVWASLFLNHHKYFRWYCRRNVSSAYRYSLDTRRDGHDPYPLQFPS